MPHSTANNTETNTLNGKTALITGAARRIGASTARILHAAGMDIIIHYRSSAKPAQSLADDLNRQREQSACILQGDLDDENIYRKLVEQAINSFGRLDVLINNASSFFPTAVESMTIQHWDQLINSNMKAPLFLSQAAIPELRANKGCIINMLDVHAQRPMREHTIYCAAKAGLAMITLSLAKELGPDIRVNGVAPGAILWPENESGNSLSAQTQSLILDRTALKRAGKPDDIAKTILFLVRDADYITGQTIAVDGGRLLNI